MTFKDKVVVVTGASRGIGRALAYAFAEGDPPVVVTVRTLRAGTGEWKGSLEETAQAIVTAGGKAIAVECDVAVEADVDAMVRRALDEAAPTTCW